MSAPDDFQPVTRGRPCVICGKPDWCRWSRSGAHECHRVDEPCVDGYERIVRTPAGFAVYRHPQHLPVRSPVKQCAHKGGRQATIEVDLAGETRRFQAAISSERKAIVAQGLGVNVAALDSIGIGQAETDDLRRLRASGAGWREDYPLVVSSFPEFDAEGTVMGICFRTDDGRKGSPSGEVGAKRGLIIPLTLPTRPDPVLLVEGPTDVAACETLGLASVGRPSNTAGGTVVSSLLAQREVLVVGENDQKSVGMWPGRDGAEKLATHLANTWKRCVRWALPPDGHKDVRAYLRHLVASGLDLNDEGACHEAGEQFLEALVTAATETHPTTTTSAGDKDDRGARDVAQGLCLDAGDHLFHDNENRAYALVQEKGVTQTLPVRSREYGLLVQQRYYRVTGSGLPSAAKTEAITTLEGLAVFEGPEERVFARIGDYKGKIVVDLCDAQRRVVVIDRQGWKIVDESPIRFRRTRGMLALPIPVHGGSITDLRPFVNVRTENDFVLVCGFVLACLNPAGPYMILLVNGEQGSAKSTLCRIVRALIDPNKSPLRCEPKDDRDLAIAANNAWMIGLDNMSRVTERVSNALCRLATGGGFATRELYSDADETIFDAKRPVMINGIGDVADRSDLIDRAIRLTLPTIPDRQRQTEKDLWAAFERARPRVLGAFFDAVSAALRNEDGVQFTRLPRMADCARWVVAAEPACPWPSGAFVAALDDQRRDADEFVIEASPLASAVRGHVRQHGVLEGTATGILDRLSEGQDEKVLKDARWPKGAQALGTKLREVAPSLRRLGIDVQFDRSAGRRTITITRNEEPPDLPSPPSPPSGAADGATLEGRGECSVDMGGDSEPPSCDGDAIAGDSNGPAPKGQEPGE